MSLSTHPTPSPAFLDILHDGKTKIGKAVCKVDGFWYFLSGSNDNGLFESHTLREIASLLDEINAPHEYKLAALLVDEINATNEAGAATYFASLPPEISREEQGNEMPF